MKKSTLISIDILAQQQGIDIAMLLAFHDFGLISILFENEKGFIAIDDLGRVQKIVSFHKELEINKEGIEVILQLLEQIHANEAELVRLKNRLRHYEEEV